MKKIVLFSLLLFCGVTLFAQQKQVVEFTEKTHDFGVVKEEVNRISYDFVFKNIHSTPVTLKSVKASCGCTTPAWSKEPIAPGQTGTITVTYSTAGRPGMFTKSIAVVLSNGSEDFNETLYIKGEVTPKAQPEEESNTIGETAK
ncbi:MAG: DUF1573 domain-containing protein [Prevotellaceae bacterium]|jgi:hypothetical protein|nr:DUF1573 domain-containing protein [Prevotellaceae bacterium]